MLVTSRTGAVKVKDSSMQQADMQTQSPVVSHSAVQTPTYRTPVFFQGHQLPPAVHYFKSIKVFLFAFGDAEQSQQHDQSSRKHLSSQSANATAEKLLQTAAESCAPDSQVRDRGAAHPERGTNTK